MTEYLRIEVTVRGQGQGEQLVRVLIRQDHDGCFWVDTGVYGDDAGTSLSGPYQYLLDAEHLGMEMAYNMAAGLCSGRFNPDGSPYRPEPKRH